MTTCPLHSSGAARIAATRPDDWTECVRFIRQCLVEGEMADNKRACTTCLLSENF